MKELKESRTCYTHSNGKWEVVFVDEDSRAVHEALLNDLMCHYVFKSDRIKRIKDVCNYDGTRTITVYYDECFHLKNVYVIKF